MTTPEAETLVFRLNDCGGGPELLRQVFLEKGWTEFDEDTAEDADWNLWWKSSRFRASDYDTLRPWQRVNHYPKSTAITKKDCLARNLKRMKGVYGPTAYDFSPLAFNLPNDYTRFVAEYTRQKEKGRTQYWICKPADLSRGRGIFIFSDLSELQYDCAAVLQRYITSPLLIAGYKFDLRIYVMVPSFQPLQVYIYEEGLVRFSTEKYDLSSLKNMFSHLTNTSINKYSPSYTLDKERVGPGCKWTLTQLRHYFRQSSIDDNLIWGRVINLIILTVAIQATQLAKVDNCFELYGFDVMIDDDLKPWLLEVNFSPALSSDCQTDIVVKKPLVSDVIDMLHFTEADKTRGGRPTTGRLPDIPQWRSPDEGVVPLVPGCGLPSVQQPATVQRPPSSSGCSSEEDEPPTHGPKYKASPYQTMRRSAKFPLYKRDSKYSVQSDSGVSSHSASSDDTSLLPQRRQKLYSLKEGTRRYADSQGRRKSGTATWAQRVSVSSAQSPNGLHKPTQRKSWTQNTAGKSAGVLRPLSLHKVGSQNKTIGRSRPWATTKPTNQEPAKPRTPPNKMGDLTLVFPFNDATRKCSVSNHGNLDVKVVIRECQRLLRDRAKLAGSPGEGRAGSSGHNHVLKLWAPRADLDTAH